MSAPTTEIGYASQSGGAWWAAATRETTPELRWPYSVQVYDAMRRQDAQVTSVLRAVTLPVRRTTWRINPLDARPEVVAHVAQDLNLPVKGQQPASAARRTRDRFSWGEHLQTSLLDLVFGHMPFEQLYRIDDAGLARLRKLAPRMPATLSAINVARDGGLESIVQKGVPKPIPVSRLVMYCNDREAGNWFGTSLLRPAYKNWVLKDRLLRVQAQTIERNGMGVPIYTAASATDLDSGRKLAESFRSGPDAGGAIPKGAKLELRGVEGTLPDAMPAIRYHDEQIARAVLAHFLNLGTQTGSWALGSTFADFFTLGLQTVAQAKADVANAHIVEDIVDLNYGPDEPAPCIEFDEIGSRHPATAAAIKMLVDSGLLRWDPDLEEALRQQYGLPGADPDAPPPAADPTAA